jgi:hypothetical protein
MLAIFVSKKWLDAIGPDAASLIVVDNASAECSVIMADEKTYDPDGPLIHVKVVRSQKTDKDKNRPFILVKIPVGYIAAIFDVTEAESKKIGFTTESD